MDVGLVLQGLVLGFSIAAPVGPIGTLCIQRSLTRGSLYGLVSGLGAATADAVYGGVAGLGLTVVTAFLLGQQVWLRLLGAVFLGYLGLRTLRSPVAPPAAAGAALAAGHLPGAYLSTFLLTLANPLTILSFTAIFAGLGAGRGASQAGGIGCLVGGVFFGSALWWLILSSVAGRLRTRITPGGLVWVNRGSGAIILGFGALALLSLLSLL